MMKKKFIGIASLAVLGAISAGVAATNVQADATPWTDFAIRTSSVRLGDGTQGNPSGLRFQTYVDGLTDEEKAQYPNAKYYTTFTFSTKISGYEQTYSLDVPASLWVQEDAWNSVLLEIPASDYGTEITAQSFIKLSDTLTYETAPVTTSLARTASRVIQKTGINNATLNAYTAGAVQSITLNETSASLMAGDVLQLSATTQPAGFGVLWSSDDESVATVDGTGKVTAVGLGTAHITAGMGGTTATFTVTSRVPTRIDFEDGKNFVVADGEHSKVGAVEQLANGTKAVAVQSNGFETDVALSSAWLAGAFADSKADSISFKLYTDMDGYATYNGYNGGTNNVTNGQLIYRKTDGSYSCKNPQYPSDDILACYNGVKITPKENGYIGVTITRVNYEEWNTNATLAGVPNSPMIIQLRLGVNENRQDVSGFGYGVQQPGKVYVDDLKADIIEKYDPVANNPLEQDLTFTSGTNAIINCFAPITESGVQEVAPGNNAVKLTMPENGYDIYVGFNADWLEYAFVTQNASKITFKVYTSMDGWGTYNKFNQNVISNGRVYYVNNGSKVELSESQASVGASEKTDGYLTLTLDKGDYEAWLQAKGTADSNLYIMMRLGDKEAGKDGFGYGYPVGDIYIDDIVIFN